MSAITLLEQCRELGVSLTPNGDKLTVDDPRGALSRSTVEAIRSHKAELLALLKHRDETRTEPSTAGADARGIPPRVIESLQRRAVESLANGTLAYAIAADALQPGDVVPLAIAIRGKAVAVLAIPRERFDLSKILDALDEHNDGARFLAAIH